MTKSEVFERAKKIRLLLLDVDGILTDGQISFSSTGEEFKSFCVIDGMGIKLLQRAGIEVGIISSRYSKVTELRARELGIKLIYQGKFSKLDIFERIITKQELSPEEVAYIPVLKRVGLAIGVPNACEPVNEFVHYVTNKPGGKGAVREVCELLLKAQGKWELLLESYLV